MSRSCPNCSAAVDPNAPPIPGFFGAIGLCLKNYFNSEGRASRSEFWYFALASSPATVLFVWATSRGGNTLCGDPTSRTVWRVAGWILLFFFAPTLEVAVRRLQDRGLSGLHWLWLFLPVAFLKFGSLVSAFGCLICVCFFLFVQLILPGTTGPNRYGPAPWRRRTAPRRIFRRFLEKRK